MAIEGCECQDEIIGVGINYALCVGGLDWTNCWKSRYEKIDHLQKLLNSRYRLTKSGYGEIVFYQLFILNGIGINNLSSIAVPNFSPLTPL